MDFKRELGVLIRSRYPLIYVVSYEEERVEEVVQEIAAEQQSRKAVFRWNIHQGLVHIKGAATALPASGTQDPVAALTQIENYPQEAIFLLQDFHRLMDDLVIQRRLRNLARQLKTTAKTIVLLSPLVKIPAELQEDVVILDFPLPGYSEIERTLAEIERSPSVKSYLNATTRERLVKAAMGLTAGRVSRVLAKAVVHDGRLDESDIGLILEEKRQIIRQTEILEYFDHLEAIDDVGGLENLKAWIRKRMEGFSEAAHDYGLPAPKGLLLIGVQGTGKSMATKAIAGLWQLPLLRLDMGKVFGSLVGESETRIRRAISIAEALAPSLLWIDELDKAFAGMGGFVGDSGTSARVFGSFITWMQEKEKPVFVIATANNVTALPPELLRKGRFDEIFFVDLPRQREREDIFRIHLKRRHREPRDYNVRQLAQATEGYSGAEIEQALTEAMHNAFADGRREFTTDDVRQALTEIIPLSVLMKNEVEGLIRWAKGRTRPASAQDDEPKFKIGGSERAIEL